MKSWKLSPPVAETCCEAAQRGRHLQLVKPAIKTIVSPTSIKCLTLPMVYLTLVLTNLIQSYFRFYDYVPQMQSVILRINEYVMSTRARESDRVCY